MHEFAATVWSFRSLELSFYQFSDRYTTFVFPSPDNYATRYLIPFPKLFTYYTGKSSRIHRIRRHTRRWHSGSWLDIHCCDYLRCTFNLSFFFTRSSWASHLTLFASITGFLRILRFPGISSRASESEGGYFVELDCLTR